MATGKIGAAPAQAESARAAMPGAVLERGEIDIDGYLDAAVEQAIALVDGKLPPDRLEWLREMLRDQLMSDPVLCERVRQATGREPQTR